MPVTDSAIEVAHRAGKSNNVKPRSIIVRCHRRDTKYTTMKLRRHLRGCGVSISEDFTKQNLTMMNDLKNIPELTIRGHGTEDICQGYQWQIIHSAMWGKH